MIMNNTTKKTKMKIMLKMQATSIPELYLPYKGKDAAKVSNDELRELDFIARGGLSPITTTSDR